MTLLKKQNPFMRVYTCTKTKLMMSIWKIEHEENIPKLTEKQRNDLEELISKEEVLSTLKRMKNRTSPGSDGFTVEFYKFF